jgi:hypothetical protein
LINLRQFTRARQHIAKALEIRTASEEIFNLGGADLLVVKAEPDGSLPTHMDWLYQVIPMRLLSSARRLKGAQQGFAKLQAALVVQKNGGNGAF